MTVVIDGTLSNPDYPRFCYSNLAASATVSASTEDATDVATNVQNGLTYNYWTPTAQDSTIAFDFGSATTINYVGIAAHNMGTQGNTINVQYFDTTWQTIVSHTPTDDSVVLFLFENRNFQQFRLQITGGSVPSIGVIYMGEQMVSERPFYGGHTPITLSKKTVLRPQTSDGGQYIGRSVIRQGVQTSIALNNLSAAWVRSTFQPFISSVLVNPFFFAWKPTTYPDEVAICWTTSDLSANNTGQADRMNTTFSVRGLL